MYEHFLLRETLNEHLSIKRERENLRWIVCIYDFIINVYYLCFSQETAHFKWHIKLNVNLRKDDKMYAAVFKNMD